VNSRNGYRTRPFDTRLGTIDLSIPKSRSGNYYPAVQDRNQQLLHCCQESSNPTARGTIAIEEVES
jgi:hypothetical protein